MKILMIQDDYESSGGDNIYINNLTCALKEKGHDIFQIWLSKKINHNSKYTMIIKCSFKNKFHWLMSNNIIDFNLYLRLRDYILEVNPDVIHMHRIDNFTKTILLAARGFKKIQTIHDIGIVCPTKKFIIGRNNRPCNKKRYFECYKNGCIKLQSYFFDYLMLDNSFFKKIGIDCFHCPSKKSAEIANKAGFETAYIPHFCNLAKSMNGINSNNVLYIGRLHEGKGINYLLKAFKLALLVNSKLRLKIVGEGPQEEELHNLASRLGISNNVDFIGKLNHDKIGGYYLDSFVVVVPSIWMEQLSLVVLEAMSYSRPVIATDNGGLPDMVINGKNGFLVKRFDVQNIAEKIVELSKNKRLANTMGKNGQKILKKEFNKEKIVEEIISVYKSVIKGKK